MKFLIIVFFYLFLFTSVTDAQTLSSSPPRLGKLVDAGGHKLHLYIQGNGTPAVIFESGSGDFSFIWQLVQPQISKLTKTVSYDRAGYAWSEPGPTPRTGRQISYELHTALRNAGVKPPYILVGQSFGGFLVRAFAFYYPEDVAGMVLVEAVHENARILIGGKPMRIREFAKGRISPEPILDKPSIDPPKESQPVVLDTAVEPPLDRLPENIKNLQIWAQSQPGFKIASDSEMVWSPEDVSRLYQNEGNPAYSLKNIPLIVLTRGKDRFEGRADSAELDEERLKLQEQLAHLSTNSKHIIDKNSGHNIHLEDPHVVIEAIKEVLNAVKEHKKLSE